MQKTREMLDATHKRFSDDDWEADLGLHEDDYDEEEACDVCGLSGTHKMSCPVTDVWYSPGGDGYCIAGDNCMCEPTERSACIDWKG